MKYYMYINYHIPVSKLLDCFMIFVFNDVTMNTSNLLLVDLTTIAGWMWINKTLFIHRKNNQPFSWFASHIQANLRTVLIGCFKLRMLI